MATIFHIMKDEFERLTKAARMYQDNIKRMPKGSLREKQIRNRDYLYLVHRAGEKIVYKYIGTSNCDRAKEVRLQIEKRKRFERLLKETKLALKDVKKVFRGKV